MSPTKMGMLPKGSTIMNRTRAALAMLIPRLAISDMFLPCLGVRVEDKSVGCLLCLVLKLLVLQGDSHIGLRTIQTKRS